MKNFFKNIVKNNDKERDHLFDNARALAMFLVVFGHFIYTYYTTRMPNSYGWYLAVYLINVPLLVFMSGYFAKFDIKKILIKLVLPLVLFWVIYDYFLCIINSKPFSISSTIQPYMTLWYLYSLIFWKCCVVGLEHIKNKWFKIAALIVFFALGLIIGFDQSATRDYSLSRSFVFLPFFAMGYFLKTSKFDFKKFKKENKLAVALIVVASIAFLLLVYEFKFFHRYLLFARSPYLEFKDDAMQGCFHRFIWYLMSTVCVFGVIFILPSFKILPLSLFSKHSMTIYLVHGFFVEMFIKFRVLPQLETSLSNAFWVSIIIMIVVSVVMEIKSQAFSESKYALSTRYLKHKAKLNKHNTWQIRLFDKIANFFSKHENDKL